ncbi:hypothetical protein Tco_1394096 [Tanacetum coccineum]
MNMLTALYVIEDSIVLRILPYPYARFAGFFGMIGWLLIELPLTAMLGLHVLYFSRVPRFLAFCYGPSLESSSIFGKILLLFVISLIDFPNELPGLLRLREIEFGIELIPGAEPISKAPYAMALVSPGLALPLTQLMRKVLRSLCGTVLVVFNISCDASKKVWVWFDFEHGKVMPTLQDTEGPYEVNYPTHDLELACREVWMLSYVYEVLVAFGSEYGNSVNLMLCVPNVQALRAKVMTVAGMNICAWWSLLNIVGMLASAAPFELLSRLKRYVDKHRRDLEISMLEIAYFEKFRSSEEVKRLWDHRGSTVPRFIGPLRCWKRIGVVSYRLYLPPRYRHVNDVFHVSLLMGLPLYPLHVALSFCQIQLIYIRTTYHVKFENQATIVFSLNKGNFGGVIDDRWHESTLPGNTVTNPKGIFQRHHHSRSGDYHPRTKAVNHGQPSILKRSSDFSKNDRGVAIPIHILEAIVSTASPTLTPFGDSDFLLFEEADSFLALEDDSDFI